MLMQKLIIEARVSGQRETNSHAPYSPEEIAVAALECWRQGASIVHYHARDPETGKPSSDPDLYAATVWRIKQECDLITMPTLGASMLATAEERVAHIVEMAKDPATKPDCVPVDMVTTNLDRYDPNVKDFTSDEHVYLNTTNMLKHICRAVRTVDVKPVSMIWDVPGVRLTEAFIDMGLYEDDPLYCELPLFAEDFIIAGHPGTLRGLQALLDFFPAGANWQWVVNVVGGNSLPLLAGAIGSGGHVALGLEDSPWEEFGCPANADLVSRVVDIARSMGREIATPAEAREMLGFT